ncbi:1306_t:CDS:2, partial [Ambispora leptoticha]
FLEGKIAEIQDLAQREIICLDKAWDEGIITFAERANIFHHRDLLPKDLKSCEELLKAIQTLLGQTKDTYEGISSETKTKIDKALANSNNFRGIIPETFRTNADWINRYLKYHNLDNLAHDDLTEAREFYKALKKVETKLPATKKEVGKIFENIHGSEKLKPKLKRRLKPDEKTATSPMSARFLVELENMAQEPDLDYSQAQTISGELTENYADLIAGKPHEKNTGYAEAAANGEGGTEGELDQKLRELNLKIIPFN